MREILGYRSVTLEQAEIMYDKGEWRGVLGAMCPGVNPDLEAVAVRSPSLLWCTSSTEFCPIAVWVAGFKGTKKRFFSFSDVDALRSQI